MFRECSSPPLASKAGRTGQTLPCGVGRIMPRGGWGSGELIPVTALAVARFGAICERGKIH